MKPGGRRRPPRPVTQVSHRCAILASIATRPVFCASSHNWHPRRPKPWSSWSSCAPSGTATALPCISRPMHRVPASTRPKTLSACALFLLFEKKTCAPWRHRCAGHLLPGMLPHQASSSPAGQSSPKGPGPVQESADRYTFRIVKIAYVTVSALGLQLQQSRLQRIHAFNWPHL